MLDRLHRQDKVAIAVMIARAKSQPRMVALFPQPEVLDEHKVQIKPPGMHVVFLPYADDMRKLEYEEDMPQASDEQVATMAKIVNKLKYEHSPDAFENPALQKHFRNLEALALDRPAPEEFEDYTGWRGERERGAVLVLRLSHKNKLTSCLTSAADRGPAPVGRQVH